MPRPLQYVLAAGLLVSVLAACGGGGGGGQGGGSSGGSTGGGGAATTPTPSTLSGVVAVGAPLGGAVVSVIDATGAAVATTTASATEGRYSLSLTTTPAGPLLVQ
ncbi:MAG: hypothetical protein CFE45_36820, partial [Burkholderiales bacterium PBB5]